MASRTTAGALSILPHHVNFPTRGGSAAVPYATIVQSYNLTVRLVATTPIVPNGLQIIDGVRARGGDTVLLTAQADPKENGLRICLPDDWLFNEGVALLPSTIIAIREGWYNQDSIWLVANDSTVSYGYTDNFFVRKDLAPVPPCRFAVTDVNTTLDETTTSIDSGTPQNGDRILVAKPGVHADNGIWIYSDTGAWMRSRDTLFSGLLLTVQQGVNEHDSLWTLVTDTPITTTFFPVGVDDVGMTVSPVEWRKLAPIAVCPPVLLQYKRTTDQIFPLSANQYLYQALSMPTADVATTGIATSPFEWTVAETGAYDCELVVETDLNTALDNRILALTIRANGMASTIVNDTTLVSATPMRLSDGWKFRIKGTILAEAGDVVSQEIRVRNTTALPQALTVRNASLKVRKLCY